MCNWINIKWNECGLIIVIVIVMNDLESTIHGGAVVDAAEWVSSSGSSGGGVSG